MTVPTPSWLLNHAGTRRHATCHPRRCNLRSAKRPPSPRRLHRPHQALSIGAPSLRRGALPSYITTTNSAAPASFDLALAPPSAPPPAYPGRAIAAAMANRRRRLRMPNIIPTGHFHALIDDLSHRPAVGTPERTPNYAREEREVRSGDLGFKSESWQLEMVGWFWEEESGGGDRRLTGRAVRV